MEAAKAFFPRIRTVQIAPGPEVHETDDSDIPEGVAAGSIPQPKATALDPVAEKEEEYREMKKLTEHHLSLSPELAKTLHSTIPNWVKMILSVILGLLPTLAQNMLPIKWGARLETKDVVLTAFYWWLTCTSCFSLFVAWCKCFVALDYRNTWVYVVFPTMWGVVTASAYLICHFVFELAAFPFFMWWIAVAAPFYCVPFLYLSYLPEVRGSEGFLKRFVAALSTVIGIIVMFGVVYPLLNVPFSTASALGQAGIAVIYIVLRNVFEIGGKLAAKAVQPDAYPVIVFMAVYAYEIFVSTVFVDIKSIWVFVMLLGCDTAENVWVIINLFGLKDGDLDVPPDEHESHHSAHSQRLPVDPANIQEIGATTVYEGIIAWNGPNRPSTQSAVSGTSSRAAGRKADVHSPPKNEVPSPSGNEADEEVAEPASSHGTVQRANSKPNRPPESSSSGVHRIQSKNFHPLAGPPSLPGVAPQGQLVSSASGAHGAPSNTPPPVSSSSVAFKRGSERPSRWSVASSYLRRRSSASRRSVGTINTEATEHWRFGPRLSRMVGSLPRQRRMDPTLFGAVMCKVSVDVTKEFVEILAPTTYLIFQYVMKYGPSPDLHANTAHATDEELAQSTMLLLVEVGLESVLLLVTGYMVKKKLKVSIVSVFMGLLSEFWWLFMTIQWCVLTYFISLQCSPAGTDWTMEFKWLEAPARFAEGRPLPRFWGGQCWTVDDEPINC